jgi:hypothetical protein
MKRSSRPRTTAALSKSLNHQLNTYALAAGAAGIGLLALAPPAEAKIIYTPTHSRVGQALPVDLNHDGVIDFYLNIYGHSATSELSACQYLIFGTLAPFCASSPGTNAIRKTDGTGPTFGAALRYGARIRPHQKFANASARLGSHFSTRSDKRWSGPWFNGGKGVRNRYLGLKFKIKGRFHFGWARLTVKTTQRDFTATLTGYAYETIPGKGIVAGKTKGPDVTTVNPASLGHLAAGASAISAWRSGR